MVAGEARGRCHCGRVRFVARFPSRFNAHCHCESCRRAHGAAFVTWVGFPSQQVSVIEGAETSSPRTSRRRGRFASSAARCGTKLFFESTRWPGETHVMLAAFDDPVDRAPYAARVLRRARAVAAVRSRPERDPARGRDRHRARRRAGTPHGRRRQGTGRARRRADGRARDRAPCAAGRRDRGQCEPESRSVTRRFGHPVVPDAVGGFAGPLAGLHAGLAHAKTPYAVTVPCDSPFLPDDLVARLARRDCSANDAQLAVARTFDQPHPVFALVRARRAAAPRRVPDRRRTQDRRVVRDAARRRGRVRRLRGRVPQHQHARRAGRGLAAVLIAVGR